MTWFYIILANLLVQIPNILAIRLFGHDITYMSAIKLGFCVIPIGFIASICFTLYFTRSTATIDYAIVNMINIGINIIIAFCVGIFILKSNQLHWLDYAGVIFIVVGIIIIIFKNTILKL
jgi:hypothetical protein